MKFLDELLVVFMMCLVFLDVVVNKQYKKYKLLWVITGIMVLYVIYSLVWISYNTPKAIMQDFIAQMKPFSYFCISCAVVPKFNNQIRTILKAICVVNITIVLLCFILGLTEEIFCHVTYLGLVAMVSALTYLLCTVREGNKVTKIDVAIVVIMLTVGLVSTRSKYYGEYIFALYMLFMYKPGLLKKINIKQVLLFVVIVLVVLFVSWQKIDYYFISGGTDVSSLDENVLQTFARPVMYTSMFVLLILHPLFGGGLASFGTFASSSSVNYSGAYAAVGIDHVWGLSEDYDAFICDAFYPELAQFGIVGIVLFIYFFVWMNKKISLLLYTSGKIKYVVGIIAIVVILIESIASTTFNQGAGAMCMMILGCLASKNKNITKQQESEIKKMSYKEKGALDYIRK